MGHPGDGRPNMPLEGVVFHLYACKERTHVLPEHHSEVASPFDDTCCWDIVNIYDTATSDVAGRVRFDLLLNGDYILAEYKTVAGYQLPLGQWLLHVDLNAVDPQKKIEIYGRGEPPPAFKADEESEDPDALILPNYPLLVVPRAGSLSSLLDTAGGAALVILASCFGVFSFFFRRRRRLRI